MKIIQLLKEQNITIPARKKGLTLLGAHEVDCPKTYCRTAREPGDDSPMKVIIETAEYAVFKCRHCLWTGHVGDEPAKPEPQADDMIPAKPAAQSAIAGLPGGASEYLQGLGLNAEMVLRHRITWDSEQSAIKIPYLENGKEINSALINPQTGTCRLTTQVVRFYGGDDLPLDAAEIIIAQRELERVIIMASGFQNVISLPNAGDVPTPRRERSEGEVDKFAFIGLLAEQFKNCVKITLAFDDTPAALELRNELARRFGPGKCWTVDFSKGSAYKTFAEMGEDSLCADLHEARPLPIRGLYELGDFEKELINYFEKGMASGVSTGWPNLDKLYTVVPGQLTVVTGIPNAGKSEVVDAISMNLAEKSGWRFAVFSPENGKEAHATKLIEKRVGMSADPKNPERMSLDTLASGMAWLNKQYFFIESTEVMPTLDWILERAADAALRYGIKGLIIDPWNRIEKKMDTFRSETDYVAAAIPRILRFLAKHQVHCWLVVHPKQQEKDRKTGQIPVPSLYDMAGSAHFVNMCDNGIVVHRSDAADDTTEIHVKKVRFKHVGKRGVTKLKYNISTGRYIPLDQAVSYAFANEGGDNGITSWDPEQ